MQTYAFPVRRQKLVLFYWYHNWRKSILWLHRLYIVECILIIHVFHGFQLDGTIIFEEDIHIVYNTNIYNNNFKYITVILTDEVIFLIKSICGRQTDYTIDSWGYHKSSNHYYVYIYCKLPLCKFSFIVYKWFLPVFNLSYIQSIHCMYMILQCAF